MDTNTTGQPLHFHPFLTGRDRNKMGLEGLQARRSDNGRVECVRLRGVVLSADAIARNGHQGVRCTIRVDGCGETIDAYSFRPSVLALLDTLEAGKTVEVDTLFENRWPDKDGYVGRERYNILRQTPVHAA